MGFVSGFVDELVTPMETAASQIRQLSKAHTNGNEYLHTQAQGLTSVFQGKGADAFSTMIQRQGQFIQGITSELDTTANCFEQAAQIIREAAQVADWALGGPLLELGEHILAKLSPHIVVEQGESAITAVVNDMRQTFHDLLHQSGGFFSDLWHGNIGGALHDAGSALGDIVHLAGDIFALLDQVETILGRWAAKVMEGANWLLNQVQSFLFKAENFVFGFSHLANDSAVLADPNATSKEKALAGMDMGFTIVSDVLMLIPGAEEGGVALDAVEKTVGEEIEDKVEQEVEGEVEQEVEQQVENEVTNDVTNEITPEIDNGLPTDGMPPDDHVPSYPSDDDPVQVLLPSNKYPETAQHIEEAIQNGQPELLHIDRGAADSNRAESLAGYPTIPGFDRDEYPMAFTQEGGQGADIKYINPSDNRGAGSVIGRQLRGFPDGTPFVIQIIDEWLL